MRAFRPQVVHAHYGTVTALFAALGAGRIPLVITYRGSDLNRLPSARGMRPAAALLLSQIAALRAARIVCVSRKLKARLWWRRVRVTVQPSGVDPQVFRPAHPQRLRE
jgi:teichuronic acid biosynthesis glycosyltransferase TuaC